jgi:hypothetical protein
LPRRVQERARRLLRSGIDQRQNHPRAIFHLGITPDTARFEQAFSADAGKNWEKNWVITFKRQK